MDSFPSIAASLINYVALWLTFALNVSAVIHHQPDLVGGAEKLLMWHTRWTRCFLIEWVRFLSYNFSVPPSFLSRILSLF